MDEDTYDGIPISQLPIDEVDWEHRGEYIRTRSKRKGPEEFDVEPEWATEAVMDPRAVVRRDPGESQWPGDPCNRILSRREPGASGHSRPQGAPPCGRLVGRQQLVCQ